MLTSIAYRNGCEYVKEAVSGTTLVDNGKTSYIQRMRNNIDTDEKFDSEQYQQMVEALYDLQEKYGIGVIDLWNDEGMNAISEKEYDVYMADPVHPTQAGYLKWWTPKMEEYLYQFFLK